MSRRVLEHTRRQVKHQNLNAQTYDAHMNKENANERLSLFVSGRSDERAKQQARAETRHKEDTDLADAVSVKVIQSVHIWPLQPVGTCKKTENRSVNS